MSKQPKKKQTDYTIGGRDISNTAIPLYQKNLTRMDTYLEDPMAAQNKYLETYYTNTPAQYDFLRDYSNKMAQLTANNYAATTGGYASQNQRNYDQQQRNENDAAARLWDAGVTSAYKMSNQDFANMLNANNSYNQAYQLGKAYSDVDQYNDMVDQMNSNWWAPVLSSAGSVVSAAFPGIGTAIGGAMQGVGNAFAMDDSALRGMQGTANGYGMYQNMMNQANMGNAIGDLFNGVQDGYNWLRNKNFINNMQSQANQLANLQDVQGQRGNFNFLA